jgi:hypothetical protein
LSENTRDVLGGLAAIALGVAAFFVLIGWQTLIVTNIGWLDFADRAMHTLGWMFFRQAPWGMPPGVSPHLGLELSNSIGLVDGLPLFALPLKLFAPWLPMPFQYWGAWLLTCFVLQALFAYAIARELGAGRLVALVAAGFAIITPVLMFRIVMHLALSGHWTVLAALYLYVRRTAPGRWMWPLLLTVTAGIHAYLLAMVLGLWVAALVERRWSGRMRWNGVFVELAASLAGVLAVLWAAGFFVTGTTSTYGYGMYKLNVLWPILTYRDWSRLVPDWPHTKYDYEGISFLGIGIFALLALAVLTGAIAQLRAVATRRWLPLTIMLLLMMVFAFSNDIYAGALPLVKFELPGGLEAIAATFRSTGRFIWPLLYVITIGTVVMLGRRLRALIAVPIVLVAFGAQAVDSWQGLHMFNRYLAPISATWKTPLLSPFWLRAAAAGYDRIRVIPVYNPGIDWKPFGVFAVAHGMGIDSAYLGRVDGTALDALRVREDAVLPSGDFEPRTLYILDAASAERAKAHLAPGDLLARIDQRIVLAKGGAGLVEGLAVQPF